MKQTLMLAAALLLGACSLSPEQIAAKEAAGAEEERRIALALAQRCDAETAHLMALEQAGWPGAAAAEQSRLQAQLQERYQDAAFQNCYQMARENLHYRLRLQALEYRERRRAMDWMHYHPAYFYGLPPFYW